MRLTRNQLIDDLQNHWTSNVGHSIPLWNTYRVDLKREIIHHPLGRNPLDDRKLFTEIALWCFDNCNGQWRVSWNLDIAYFVEETDKMGFLLRWL